MLIMKEGIERNLKIITRESMNSYPTGRLLNVTYGTLCRCVDTYMFCSNLMILVSRII